MSKITFIGGGSFGTALSIILGRKGNTVSIYDIEKTVVDDININRRNDKYIKGLEIPTNVTAFSDLDEAIDGAEYIVLAVPSNIIRMVSKNLKRKIDSSIPVITIAKGIEKGTNLRLSQVIGEELDNPVVILSGPSHAEEVAFNIPTTVVSSSNNSECAEKIQDLFMTPEFRVYTNNDLIAVEIGGAIKNVIALAAGVCDGIGYGDNTKAALMTRGMAEIVRVGTALGGNQETFFGLTGIGDLIVTCGSQHSRNRKAGYLIGQGMSVEEATKEVGMVVEGIKACEGFYELKEKINVEMPITDITYKVLFEGLCPHKGLELLLNRDKKSEMNFI